MSERQARVGLIAGSLQKAQVHVATLSRAWGPDLVAALRATWINTLMVVLGPVLLVQGWHVRRVTPKLPEPDGAREGLSLPDAWHGMPSQRPFRVLILGDSSAAGVGAATQQQALAGLLPPMLANRMQSPVQWRLVAQTGVCAEELVSLLQLSPADPYDVVCVAVGVNDATQRRSSWDWSQLVQQLLQLLRLRHGDPLIVFSALPPMHRFLALPQPLRSWMGMIARHLDLAAQDVLSQHPRARYLPLPDWHQREGGLDAQTLMASDGFHPGPLAYRIWAYHLCESIICSCK